MIYIKWRIGNEEENEDPLEDINLFSLETFFQLYAIFIAVLIGIFIFRKIRQKGTIEIEVLKPSQYYEKKRVKPDGEKLKIKRGWIGNITPKGIFTELKPFWKFWRLPKQKMYFGENQTEPLTFNNPDGEVSELSKYWTGKEIRKFIRKEVLKARSEIKPMSNMMFYVLILVIMANVFLTVLIGNRLGVF